MRNRILWLTLALSVPFALATACVVEDSGPANEGGTGGNFPNVGGEGGGNPTTGGTGGTGGTTQTGGSAGEAGNGNNGEGGKPDVGDCIPATSTATPDCDDLPYAEAAEKCTAPEPDPYVVCTRAAAVTTEGAFAVIYDGLELIKGDVCSKAASEAALAVIGTSPDSTETKGVRGRVCANAEAKTACTSISKMKPNGQPDVKDCEYMLGVLNPTGIKLVEKCMGDETLNKPWQEKFAVCRLPALFETNDTAGQTQTCKALSDLCGSDTATPVEICKLYDENWARGPWFDELVLTLADAIGEDATVCTKDGEAAGSAYEYRDDLRREALPTALAPDYCDDIIEKCVAVPKQECVLRLDILKSTAQKAVRDEIVNGTYTADTCLAAFRAASVGEEL
jgi:hypothetical protein